MKKLSILMACIIVLHFRTPMIEAQVSARCGDSIEGSFVEDRVNHLYSIDVSLSDRLLIYAEVPGTYQDLKIDLGLTTPSGFVIDNLNANQATTYQIIKSEVLSQAGKYTIGVRSNTRTGGAYVLHIDCIHLDGSVTTADSLVTSSQCGAIHENSFSRDRINHYYYISLSQGDNVFLSAEILGGTYSDLQVDIGITAPSGFVIDDLNANHAQKSPVMETQPLVESGIYEIGVRSRTDKGGDYRLFVGCTLADGKIINPGDAPPLVEQSIPTQANPTAIPTSFVGFPGIAPVDFANAFQLPLSLGTPMPGSIPPAGDAVLGLTFDGNAGDTFALDFTRTAGNLNLGVVILSDNNEVVFQASLVTSESLSTRLTLPSAGQYTIGVFRIDLLPPATPEATQFQVTGTLNP